jgi:hypothetical protein
MMARLPTPGSDNGNWGDILNDYLNQAHQDDGTLKPIPQNKVAGLQNSLQTLTDAQAAGLQRANHTGTQLASTIADFTAAVDARAGDAAFAARFASYLNLAMNPDSIIGGTITRDANGVAIAATGWTWPDGTTGAYTGTVGTSGAIDSYVITYGSPVTRTYTQPTMTRDANGSVITRPAMVVS